MTEAEIIDAAVRASAKVVIEAMARLLDSDQHGWSSRPCGTCSEISALLGRPFGCYRNAADRAAREAARK